ncbi:MAG: serine/threonine protein kinase [uncultured Nocardioidaceae bacterium]|uniref:non-specific serine/threonine protein kinase n=1 Tax=uncultured Nocardioidaceae bacterium TaxID=253824 RepID=A0A6J4NBL0_9ACTN|nr:MAG: serine/threonine protein kinase [uncultured Nocardioidaceae bacterium]
MNSQPGRVIGARYRLLRVIGHGGMGVVWAARDQTLDRLVAVKEVIPPSQLDERERQQAQERILREARAAGGVASVAAVSVYDVFATDEHSWVVMELLDGPTLDDVIRDSGPLSVAQAIAVGDSLVDALAAAHQAGVLHRDVKPGNVILAKRGAVLTDFGIAHRDGDPGITTTGLVVGSPSYLAPERARGETSGQPADVWALGATLYAAVEGHPPFERPELLAALHAVVSEPVPEPQRAGVLTPLLLQLLKKDPAERPTLDETREMLTLASRGQPGSTAVMPVAAGTAADGHFQPAWATATNTPPPADDWPAESSARGDEPSARVSRPRRRSGSRWLLAGVALLLATVLVAAVAGWLPDLLGPDGEAADTATGPPEPFETQTLYSFARDFFEPGECSVPSPEDYPVSAIEPDTELVKCVSDTTPYSGTFWCKNRREDLLADRRVYLDRAVGGTRQAVAGSPAGRSTPVDGIQVAFNHAASNGARVYWDSPSQLCAGELQTLDDDVQATVEYWRDGSQ